MDWNFKNLTKLLWRIHKPVEIRYVHRGEVWEKEVVRNGMDRYLAEVKTALPFRPLPPESIPSSLRLVKTPVVFWTLLGACRRKVRAGVQGMGLSTSMLRLLR